MTQRTRRVSVRENTEGQQQILIPLQIHNLNRDHTYSSEDNASQVNQDLMEQLEEWKTKCEHLESHYEKLEIFKENYDRILRENGQLNSLCKEKDYQIDSLRRDLERSDDELKAALRRKKTEVEEGLRVYRKQIECLKGDLEQSQNKVSNLQSTQRKKKRDVEKQLSRLRESLSDSEQRLIVAQQSLQRTKGENQALKKKLKEMQIQGEVPVGRNMHLTSQNQDLARQLRSKQEAIFRHTDSLTKMEVKLSQQADKYRQLEREIQSYRLSQDSWTKKMKAELDRLKSVESSVLGLQREIIALDQIIATKNQEISVLLQKLDSRRIKEKQSSRTNAESGQEDYYNQFSKLQEQLSDKYSKYKKEREFLQDKIRQIQESYEERIAENFRSLEQKDLTIISLQVELESVRKSSSSATQSLEQANTNNQEIINSLNRGLDQRDEQIGRMGSVLTQLENEIKYLEAEKYQVISECRSIQDQASKTIYELQERISSLVQKQNNGGNNRNQVLQLYEAKLSSKDELIELLRLRLKNHETGGESNFRTRNNSILR